MSPVYLFLPGSLIRSIAQLEEKVAKLEGERFLLSRFQGDDKLIHFYTGFPDFITLKAVYLALQPTAKNIYLIECYF